MYMDTGVCRILQRMGIPLGLGDVSPPVGSRGGAEPGRVLGRR